MQTIEMFCTILYNKYKIDVKYDAMTKRTRVIFHSKMEGLVVRLIYSAVMERSFTVILLLPLSACTENDK